MAMEGAETQALSHLANRLTLAMKSNLRTPIQLAELHIVLLDVKVGKLLGPDGVVLEFYR
jgi:hypothetical protein